MKKDFANALADIREVLVREPRHFGALSGLGMIMQEVGDDKHALDAFRRALAVHPHLEKIPDLVKTLDGVGRRPRNLIAASVPDSEVPTTSRHPPIRTSESSESKDTSNSIIPVSL